MSTKEEPKENHLSIRAKRKNRIPDSVILLHSEASHLPEEELQNIEIVAEKPEVIVFDEDQQVTTKDLSNKSNKKKSNNNNNKQEASSSDE